LNKRKTIELGIKIADSRIYEQDKIWSRYSGDKVDIGKELGMAIRTLAKILPLSKPLRAISIGSGAEPQFRILEDLFCAGLYLLDLDKQELDIVKERIHRQHINHVVTILADYNKVFLNPKKTELFLKTRLSGKKVNLIAIHHSLYYCKETMWTMLFNNIYRQILAPLGAIHTVLMAAKCKNQYTTTWLYNHFVGKFFGEYNNQNLLEFKKQLRGERFFSKAYILSKTNCISFFVNDFAKFMAAIWMVLLYPNVYKYNLKQKEEITEFVYEKFWQKKKPLLQMQDHVVIYKGTGFRALI